jgi:hypothetical protein
MNVEHPRTSSLFARPSGGALLGFAFLGPPLVWLTTLQAVYSFAAYACDADRSRGPIYLMVAVGLGLVLVSMLVASRRLAALDATATAPPRVRARRRFLAIGGLVLGLQFVAAIVAQGLGAALLAPCQ